MKLAKAYDGNIKIYHNIKKLKLPCMPSKEEQESGMVKFVNVGSASITKKT